MNRSDRPGFVDEGSGSLYSFGGGATLSAFSAYNLLRNCNYLLAPQPTAEIHSQILRTPDRPIQPQGGDDPRPPGLDIQKSLIGDHQSKHLFASAPVFGFSHHHHPHLHILPSDDLSRSSRVISPCSPLFGTNFRRQRGEKKPIPDEQKDDKYFERRRRNNQAAKKSRDARKIREDQIALRATILEHENALLRAQVITLREETSSLRQMLLQKKALELSSRDQPICS